jgi:hypothetical protein
MPLGSSLRSGRTSHYAGKSLEQNLMKRILPLLLLLAAGTAQAVTTPTVPPAKPGAAAPAQAPTPTRFPGVSEAGNAVLAKAQTTPDPQLQALIKQNRAIHDQLVSTIMAPVVDIDKVESILRQRETVQAQLRTHSNDRLLAAARALPESDRGVFLRTLLMDRPAPVAPATPRP